MEAQALYAFFADAILIAHSLFVVFVVLGLILIFAGGFLSWGWVRNLWFRLAHLLGISIVVVQSWFDLICPLTTWEMALRVRAGGMVYEESFVSHWLHQLLYYRAPPWVFIVCYTLFGVLVLSSWFLVPPRRSGTDKIAGTQGTSE